MPIYEYKCTGCGMHREYRQSVNDEPMKICESCGGELEKQWSLSGFQFKGDGWYVTDYSKNKDVGKTASPAAEKSSSSESTSDAAPASKENKTETKTETAANKKAE
jgi:putative FmdB family regulatory protein